METLCDRSGKAIWYLSRSSAELTRDLLLRRMAIHCRIIQHERVNDPLHRSVGYCLQADRSGIDEPVWREMIGAAWTASALLELDSDVLAYRF